MSRPRKPTPPSRPAANTNTAKERRQAELEQRQAENRRVKEQLARQQLIRKGAFIGGGVLAVALVIWLIVQGTHGGTTRPRFTGTITGVVTFQKLSANHVQGQVTYPQTPPVGGDHNITWLNCGIYPAPVPNVNAVHDLEHGAVWITYQSNLASKDVDALQNLVRGHDHALLSPYPGIPSPVVASAWGVQLQVPTASDPRLGQFLSKYENSPGAPEPGAPCSGGVGAPIG